MVDTRLPVQTILPQADVEMLMHQPVRTCRPEDTLAEAARLMWEADCGIVPVVSPDRVLLGVLTDRDVCMAAWLQGQTLSSIPMGSVMQTRVETVHPESTPEEAHSLMRQRGIRRLPVVNETGGLVGILTVDDLVRFLAGEVDSLVQLISREQEHERRRRL